MLKTLFLVGIGGFLGSVLRFSISKFVAFQSATTFPLGTFTVNILGSLIIGLIYGLALKDLASSELRLLVATGFCGGFTTFSSFSFEFLTLLRDDHIGLAFLYAAGSLAMGLAAVWIGLQAIKLW